MQPGRDDFVPVDEIKKIICSDSDIKSRCVKFDKSQRNVTLEADRNLQAYLDKYISASNPDPDSP